MSLMPWDGVVDLVKDGIDKIWPDKTKAAELKAQVDEAAAAGKLQEMALVYDNAKAQLDVDKTEAANTSTFVSGWRPGIGWVCGSAFAWAYVLQPMGTFICAAVGHPLQLPALDISGMMPVLLGMLGLGAMRSFDKTQGTGNGH